MGTITHMAPETLNGGEAVYSEKSDMYPYTKLFIQRRGKKEEKKKTKGKKMGKKTETNKK